MHINISRAARLFLLCLVLASVGGSFVEAQTMPMTTPVTQQLSPAQLLATMQAPAAAWLPLGDNAFNGWTGLRPPGIPGTAAIGESG